MKTLKLLLSIFALLVSATANADVLTGDCGKDGDNLKYTLDTESGVLKIEGSGEMADFTESSCPWYSKCDSISKIELPDGLTYIGTYAFRNCVNVSSISIPSNVTGIGASAFFVCSGITSLVIPKSVATIGTAAFGSCSGLNSVKVEDGNTKYNSPDGCNVIIETETNKLIVGCSNSTIPDYVRIIGERAFQGCSGMISLTLPDSLTEIEDFAFALCTGLTSLTIPKYVTTFGKQVFAGCNNVTTLNYNAINATASNYTNEVPFPETITTINIGNGVRALPQYLAYKCTGLTYVKIPNSVVEIRRSVFSGCTGLTSIVIPKSVVTIGVGALSCENLYTMTSEAEYPPSAEKNPFNTSSIANGTLYVPAKSVDAYKVATYWKNWKNIEAIPGSDVPEEKDTVYVEVHDTVYVDKIIEKEVIKEVTVEVHDTTYVDKIIEVEVPVEKLVEVHDTIYVYDDTRSEIVLPSGDTMTLYVRDGIVYIENAPLGELITSYTIDGEMYEATRVKDTTTTLTLPRGAIYVIKVGEKTFKIKI